MTDYRELDVANPSSSELFNFKQTVKIIFHGYTIKATIGNFDFFDIKLGKNYSRINSNNWNIGWVPPVAEQLAKIIDGYVIFVDYGRVSNCSYDRSVLEIVPSIGYYVASVLPRFNFDPSKVELIGHSLGAHMAGYVGAALNGSLQRITGDLTLKIFQKFIFI